MCFGSFSPQEAVFWGNFSCLKRYFFKYFLRFRWFRKLRSRAPHLFCLWKSLGSDRIPCSACVLVTQLHGNINMWSLMCIFDCWALHARVKRNFISKSICVGICACSIAGLYMRDRSAALFQNQYFSQMCLLEFWGIACVLESQLRFKINIFSHVCLLEFWAVAHANVTPTP